MKSLLTFLSFICAIPMVRTQSFFYTGYGVGMYTSKEAPAENMCTKFNLGWDIEVNSDGCLVNLTPGANTYTIEKEMDWGNYPHGFRLGGVFGIQDVVGLQLGLNYMNQKSSGKRTNTANTITETFSLKTRMCLFTMNFVVMKNKTFQPYIGFDMGINTFRFSYDNGSIGYHDELMGYKTKLFGGSYEPGDRSLVVGFNLGCFIQLLETGPIAFKVVPGYQYMIKGMGDINEVIYPDLIFNHSNFNVSFLLTYSLGKS